ncbi:MAG TPA: carbohydrate ABC transporter permease [Candidatus Limnocylindrales bacterium]|nr:carbohydrate ABC transporter permease [Candidatus Limnocylindrales bacterium]
MAAGSIAAGAVAPRQSGRFHLPWRAILVTLVVLPFAVPFVWLILSALKPADQFYAFPPTLLPNPPSLANVDAVLRLLETPRLFANTLLVASLSTVFTVVSSAVVGFAFATIPARGSRLLFAVLIGTILIPQTALIVPQFILFSRLGWVGSYLPLIVPHLFGSAFFIFLFRQWFKSLPAHLFESAELDGATPLQAFRHVGLPLAGPAIAAVAVFSFIAAWNDFLGPLIYLRSPDTFTVSVAMATLDGIYVQNPQNSVAMALIVLIPPIVVFFIAQRFLVRGVGATGWRG